MGGKRTSQQEIVQLELFTNEGLTCNEIAQRLGRSPAAIRNLRYKKNLAARTKSEFKFLFQQKDELSNAIKSLQSQKTTLVYAVNDLKKEKLEEAIKTDRTLIEQILTQILIKLKVQRPDLFVLSCPEQIAMLLKLILK
jgi:hypothetical protein